MNEGAFLMKTAIMYGAGNIGRGFKIGRAHV